MSRDIKQCNSILQDAWKFGQEEWKKNFPSRPQIIITCTLRSLDEQAALFAQGRNSLIEINRLRKTANLTPIKESEARKKITNAKPGQSKHNPDKNGLSNAFDIAFVNLSSGKNTSLNWDTKNFLDFYTIISKKFNKIQWGGNWKSFKDYPHFEI